MKWAAVFWLGEDRVDRRVGSTDAEWLALPDTGLLFVDVAYYKDGKLRVNRMCGHDHYWIMNGCFGAYCDPENEWSGEQLCSHSDLLFPHEPTAEYVRAGVMVPPPWDEHFGFVGDGSYPMDTGGLE